MNRTFPRFQDVSTSWPKFRFRRPTACFADSSHWRGKTWQFFSLHSTYMRIKKFKFPTGIVFAIDSGVTDLVWPGLGAAFTSGRMKLMSAFRDTCGCKTEGRFWIYPASIPTTKSQRKDCPASNIILFPTPICSQYFPEQPALYHFPALDSVICDRCNPRLGWGPQLGTCRGKKNVAVFHSISGDVFFVFLKRCSRVLQSNLP